MLQLGIELRCYPDGASALVHLLADDPAAVLIPTDMLGVGLVNFVQAVMTAADLPIVVAVGGAAGEGELAYRALDDGARTLIAAPFTPDQLSAKIRQLDVRYISTAPLLERGSIVLDPDGHTVLVSGTPRTCSPREFILLQHLLVAGERVVSLEEIANILGLSLNDENTARVQRCVRRMRRILDAGRAGQPSVIENIRGVGYRISLATPSASRSPNQPADHEMAGSGA
jgi:DNA-binding response OmpR family regulator